MKFDLGKYVEGIDLLVQSGVFEYVQKLEKVVVPPAGSDNFEKLSLVEIGRSQGFGQALDSILNFREMFLTPNKTVKPVADYGAIDFMKKNMNLSEDEEKEIGKQFGIR